MNLQPNRCAKFEIVVVDLQPQQQRQQQQQQTTAGGSNVQDVGARSFRISLHQDFWD
jgi:hypothetical protein